MIKKIFALCLIIVGINSIYSQQDSISVYQIQYERTLNLDHLYNPLVATYEYTKFIEYNKSIYKKKSNVKKSNSSLVKEKDNDSPIFFNLSGKNVGTVFKNYGKNEFFYKHQIINKPFVVKDSLTIFNWAIKNKKKEILGFSCQLASMDFRGRKYEAWFSTELPVGGPWKYDGLPGMILELKSTDNFIAFKTISIKNNKIKLGALKNPFKTKKTLTWDQFKALYKKKALELFTYQTDKHHLGTESSRGGIEMYISEDDREYNKALKAHQKKQ
ncbi:GLPGLI family protein [Tenacibaculum sp. HL-MS23]|uniref:GLPGLI family protein n=1 Tax=Tenacibaculum TaxID=104267 RepID=UPI001C4E65C6|nr:MULTISPECIES: GLPGLI family protein [Tenacibaculum]QXP73920.1 GLPGLI family protein [Tenacibaculum sp. AHE14PA]QXP75713.1 GLPGLI family protein [Tenacibaculum sp. AHE15PA]WNW02273.1 GLPGLI family protein [Tenacibaculum sp. HL-MS23]